MTEDIKYSTVKFSKILGALIIPSLYWVKDFFSLRELSMFFFASSLFLLFSIVSNRIFFRKTDAWSVVWFISAILLASLSFIGSF